MSNQPDSLKIAVFTETFLPKIDGIVTILCLMLERYAELGHQVILFGPAGGPETYAGAKIVGVKGPPLPPYPELRINLPRRYVWQELKAFDPDVVHVVNPAILGPFGMYFGRRLKKPIVASFHTDIGRYAAHYGYSFLTPSIWAYFRALHNRAHLNVATSTFMRDDLRSRGYKRMRWWKRGIDTAKFTPGPVDAVMRDRMTDGHPDEFLVAYVGRLAREKNLAVLRDAIFPQPGVRLALVGDGPAKAELEAHFAGTPTAFPGYLTGDALLAAYRAADVFVFPSLTETFGLVALEAMACRVPVIAARAGGIVDTVNHEVNGLMFDPDQPAQIGAYVRRLKDDPDERERFAAAGLAHAQSRDWRATMDQMAGYYRKAIRVKRIFG